MTDIKCMILSSFNQNNIDLKDYIKKMFDPFGIQVYHASDVEYNISIFDGIKKMIDDSDFIIAEISDYNPNVLYELGYATGKDIPIVILIKEKEIPSNINLDKYLIIKYEDYTHISSQKIERIIDFINNILNTKVSYDEHIGKKDKTILNNPFDYLSAENLSLDLLNSMIVIPPYKNRLITNENVILSGPRGCGKSMILKYLRYSNSEVENDIIGFYNNFNLLRGIFESTELINQPYHMIAYFQLSLLRSIIYELEQLKNEKRLDPNKERVILSIFNKIDNTHNETIEKLSVFLQQIQYDLQSGKINQDLDESKEIAGQTIFEKLKSITFLSEITKELVKSSIFSDVSLAFLLDDFSNSWLPHHVKCLINTIIFTRSEYHSFKIASIHNKFEEWPISESRIAEPEREYIPIDLGEHFLSNKNKKITFLAEIINKRLSLAGSTLTIKQFLPINSKSPYNSNYSGFDSFSSLFSGDISLMLNLLSGMNAKNPSLNTPIRPEVQSREILMSSRRMLNRVQSSSYGTFPYHFLMRFMQFVHHQSMINPTDMHPHVIPGFEIEDYRNLHSSAREKMNLLLSSGSILPIKSMRGNQRFIIRKMLFPAFRLNPMNEKKYLTFNLTESEKMLLDYEEFWRDLSKEFVDKSSAKYI